MTKKSGPMRRRDFLKAIPVTVAGVSHGARGQQCDQCESKDHRFVS